MSRHYQDIDKLIKIHRPHQVRRNPEAVLTRHREQQAAQQEPMPAQPPTYHQMHNERHKLIAQGLRAGDGFERSALAVAAFMRAKYGFVAIKDTEMYFISEIGLKKGNLE